MPPLRAEGRVVAGRYKLTEPIGRGAMGVVWRARDRLLDRDVAIKEVFFKGAISDEDRENAYKRTMREARTAARLSHRGVVTIYDVAEEDGRPWIIMELVPSRSLEKMLASDGPLSPRRACRIGQQLLAALAHAHAAGVLHRDVKPGNVLIADDPDGERAVLTDFGIAQFAGDPRLTQTGMVMGSPGFTAPERIRGGTATPASDLWSLGATLFAAVEGHGPYEKRGGAITTMTAIINEDAPAAKAAGPLGPLIAALLHRNPRLRPPAGAAGRMFAGVLPLLPPEPLPAQRGPRLALKALPGPAGADSTSPVPATPVAGAPVPVVSTVPGTVPGALAAPEEKADDSGGAAEASESEGPVSDGSAPAVPDDRAEAEDGLPENASAAGTAPDEEAPADEAAADAPVAEAAPEDSPVPDEAEIADVPDVPDAPDPSDIPDEQDVPTVDAPTADVLAESRAEVPEAISVSEATEVSEAVGVSRDDDASGAADAEPAQEASEDDTPEADAPHDAPSAEDGVSREEASPDAVPSFRLAAALTEEPPTMVANGPPAITATIAPPTAVLPATRPPTLSPPAPGSRPLTGVPPSDDAPTRPQPQPAGYRPAAGYLPPTGIPRRRRGRRAVIAVAVLVSLVVIGAAVALMTSHGLSTTGNTASASTSLPGAVKAINSPATVTPAGWSSKTVSPAEHGTAGGFTVAVPSGWAVRQRTAATYLDSPDGNQYLDVDLTQHSRGDMLAEAQYVERNALAEGHLPGYRRLDLRRVTIRGTSGAFWSFTWMTAAGVTMEVNDLLFDLPTSTGSQSYAVYFTAPAAQFSQSQGLPLFDQVLQTFQPVTN